MEYILAALKETANQPLRDRLKVCKNTFITHRQMGEPESYYRLIPSLHLTHSNIGTIFVCTGFNKSRFLKSLTEEEAKHINPKFLINLDGNDEACFVETPNMRDKYLRRPEILESISLAQFAKRFTTNKNNTEEVTNEATETAEQCPDDYGIKDNFIITPNESERNGLPRMVELVGDSVVGESNFLKIRKPLALRYHKVKETTDPHEFFFSEMELFTPFRSDSELCLDNFDNCEKLYRQRFHHIQYVKSRVMEFLEKVEESRENAQEMVNEQIAAEMDAEVMQDNADCNEHVTEENVPFIALDSENMHSTLENEAGASEGLFKRIEIQDESYLRERTDGLDKDQKYVIDVGLTYAKDILKFRTGKAKPPKSPMLTVQGGAGSGKSHVIDILSQWLSFY